MITYLSEQTGESFEIVFRDSYEEMLNSYKKGNIDILITGPFNYIKTKSLAGAEHIAAVIRSDENPLQGVIITKNDSDIHSIRDLKNKSFAFTDIHSTTGYLIPRIALNDIGITQPANFFSRVIFTGHHSASLEALLSGRIDSVAIADYFLKYQTKEKLKHIKILYTSKPLPPETIFARPNLNKNVLTKIQTALLEMYEKVSPDIMKKLDVMKFIQVNNDSYNYIQNDYDILKQLPKIKYAIEYEKAPSQLNSYFLYLKHRVVRLFFAIPILLLIISLFFVYVKYRSATKSSKLFQLGSVTLIFAFSLIITLYSVVNLQQNIDNQGLSWLKHIDTFTDHAAFAEHKKNNNQLQIFAEGLANFDGIDFVKVYRKGKYIADSQNKDLGFNITPKILSDTFNKFDKNIILVNESILKNNQRYGIVQVGIDKTYLNKLVKSALIKLVLIVSMLYILGCIIIIIWSKKLSAPFTKQV